MFRLSGPDVGIRLGNCVVDRARRLVVRGTEGVRISPKAFHLLEILLDRSPHVVPKTELLRLLWPDAVVVEANLSNLVGELRGALGESSRSPVWVRTVHGYGYGIDQPDSLAEDSHGERSRFCWLVHEGRHFELPEGEHLIGRHPRSVVPIGDPTVSRRHARIDLTWCVPGGGGQWSYPHRPGKPERNLCGAHPR